MGLGSWLKKLGRNVDPFYSKGAVGHVTAPVTKPIAGAVRYVGRQVDLTSSRSVGGLGRYVAPIARPAVATAAAAVTGGASVVLGERGVISRSAFGVKPTAEGYATGAAVGLAVLGGRSIGGAVAGAVKDKVSGGSGGGSAAPAATPPVEVTAGETRPDLFHEIVDLAFPGVLK